MIHSKNLGLPSVKKIKKTNKPKTNYPSSALLLSSWPIYNRTIHIHETDRSGVIHFSNYFKIAEEALYSGLKRLCFSFGNFEHAISVINTEANSYQPIKFTDHISVIITDIKVEQDQLVFSFDFNDSDHTCLTKMQLAFVLIETKNRKAIPIPEDLKNRLNQKTTNKNNEDATSSIQIYT